MDTALHNWSSLSYNTTNQPFKCLSMIRQRGHTEGERDKDRGKSGEWKCGKLMEMESWERLWSAAPLGDSSKSWTAAAAVRTYLCVYVSVCAANSEQKTFFVALSDNKIIQK